MAAVSDRGWSELRSAVWDETMADYAAQIAEDEAVEAAAMGLRDVEDDAGLLGGHTAWLPAFEDLDDFLIDDEEAVPPDVLEWHVVVRCRRCVNRGVAKPPTIAIVGKWAGVPPWTVLRRTRRRSAPKTDDDLRAHIDERYPSWSPQFNSPETPRAQEIDRRRAVLLSRARAYPVSMARRSAAASEPLSAVAENLRAPFAEAPEGGRFTIDCGRGHRVQTTALGLRRVGERARSDGGRDAEATL